MSTKHLIYEPFSVSVDDPIISGAVNDAVREFGDTDKLTLDIRVKITMEIQ